ncbi:unnamed protein product [Haemonchus placei]|uniref:Uncharacterized protein n=1 Tax=Haemonchus placei TaxID=6290 RepID=A0A3P7SM47_HAEPC|nr:unnamed protein product [Haemonchus placei]
MHLRVRTATIMTMDEQQMDETKEKKDDITRLRKGEFRIIGWAELKAEGVKKTNLLEILAYASPHWKMLTIGLTACVIGGLVYPTYSVVFMQVITSFSNPDTLLSTGHFWALMFLVLAGIQGCTMFGQFHS